MSLKKQNRAQRTARGRTNKDKEEGGNRSGKVVTVITAATGCSGRSGSGEEVRQLRRL
jgi:hypothetical protein